MYCIQWIFAPITFRSSCYFILGKSKIEFKSDFTNWKVSTLLSLGKFIIKWGYVQLNNDKNKTGQK